MKEENKVRVFNRLFFKLYLNYAIVIVVAALLIGLIFMQLYTQRLVENSIEELQKRADIISKQAANSINNSQNEFLKKVDTLQTINDWDIWTISNPNAEHPMGEKMETGDSYDEFVAADEYSQYEPYLNAAFLRGEGGYFEKYDEVYEKTMITVCQPIMKNGEAVGAVFIKQGLDVSTDMAKASLTPIFMSIILSLGISFIIVIVFATKLSLPLTRMRATALQLAAGNYNIKTGIVRNDEIGDLAKTVDMLSEKLLENDIERKKLDQMKLDFFANVSHELRTPITVMRAYTETLVDGVVTDQEKVQQYYGRMLSECKSMERLVGDLLTLSKMQNPDFAIEKEPVSLQQIFDEIIRSAGAIAEKKNITIEIIEEGPNSVVLGDYDRLRQMFMVILDNAIKFSDENKTVHIKIETGDTIKVSIRDEGIGIEAVDMPNLFQKFYKSNLRQNASGTGLGLAIAKQIAIKHDGIVDVNSTPGVGTEFIFTFPKLILE